MPYPLCRTTDGSTVLPKGGVEPIRHILFPPIPVYGAMNFHITKFAFSVVAVILQYLNMYRTVWWLSRPWTKYPVVSLVFILAELAKINVKLCEFEMSLLSIVADHCFPIMSTEIKPKSCLF